MSVEEHTTTLVHAPIPLAQAPVVYRTAATSASAPDDQPTNVFIHGALTSSAQWVPFLERAGGLAPDLIGFGRSAKGGHLDYSLDGYADFLQVLLKQLGIGKVRLVMHGLGAAVGLLLAQRRPSRVERMVLLNPLPLLAGFSWPRLAAWWRKPLIGELIMGSITKGMLERILRSGSIRDEAWSAERIETVWEDFDQGTQRAMLRVHRDATPERLAAAGAELALVEAGTLVVWGERDPWLEPSWGRAYAERLPRATLESVPEAGHWPWLDAPRTIELVASFL